MLRQLKAARENIKESLAACAIAPGHDSMVYAITQGLGASIELAARRPQVALQDFDAALATFARAGKGTEGRTGDGKAERALALAMTGDLTSARREFDALLPAQPEYSSKAEFTHLRGTIEHLAGRYADAIALQQQALSQIKAGPTADHARTRFLAQSGLSRAESGDIDAAEKELQQALELAKSLGLHPDPLQADARVGLARVHLKRSQPAHAVQLLKEADAFWRDFDPGNSAARETERWLAVALDRAGNEKRDR